MKPLPRSLHFPRIALSTLALAAMALGLLRTGAAPTHAQGSQTLVINEIDYLQPGGDDEAEFVELLNVSLEPVQLGDHALVGVNNGGSLYRRFPLPDYELPPGAYFVICGRGALVPNCDYVIPLESHIWTDDGVGNPPNAIAILQEQPEQEAEVLVDSVSYEGDVPGGPDEDSKWTEAKGIEFGDDPSQEHHGISREPDGQDTDDNESNFKGRCITPGAANETAFNNCPPAKKVPGLVINELDYINQGVVDDAEFIEIKNDGDLPQSLGRFSLYWINQRSEVRLQLDFPAVILEPGDYYVVCGNSGKVPNCDYSVDRDLDLLFDSLSGGIPNAVAIVKRGVGQFPLEILVDSVSYEGSVQNGPLAGGTWTEVSGITFGDIAAEAHIGVSRTPDGEDSDHNALDFTPRCITPGLPNTEDDADCPEAVVDRSLVINEADYTQGEVDTAEFVEIKNISQREIQLSDYTLIGVDNQASIYRSRRLPDRLLPPGGYFVVCANAQTVPNCDLVDDPGPFGWMDRYTTQSLFNAIALISNRSAGLEPDDPRDDMLVDTVSYDGQLAGGPDTGGFWTETTGVDPGDDPNRENASLSRLPDGEDSDVNADDFGLGCNTPGYVNAAAPPTNACEDPGTLTPTPTNTATSTPTVTSTPEPTSDATATETATPSRTPTATATATATDSGGGDPSPSPTPVPTDDPGGLLNSVVVNDPGNRSDTIPGDGACTDPLGRCTLRAAIQEINATAGNHEIHLILTAGGPIMLPAMAAPLPALTRRNVRIDGTAGGGPSSAEAPSGLTRLLGFLGLGDRPSAGTQGPAQSAGVCSPGQTIAGSGEHAGLSIQAADVVVIGLDLHGFEVGIDLSGSARGARIGSDGDGDGDAQECNAVWDNSAAQIRLDGISVFGNQISGNHIGVDASGAPGPVPRSARGIEIVGGASDNLVGIGQVGGGIGGLGNRIQNNAVGIRIAGRSGKDNVIQGNLIGSALEPSWHQRSNGLGILVAEGSGTAIGGAILTDDADVPASFANRILYNMLDGVVIERNVTDTSLRANEIMHNRRDGVRLAQTITGGNGLRSNRISDNGGAAIAVNPLGPQLAPPKIEWVDLAGGQLGGSSCPTCIVELFSDPAEEAAVPLARAQVLSDGQWSLSGLDLLGLAHPYLSAHSTNVTGSTSRLGKPRALGAAWSLIELPGRVPNALRPGSRICVRDYLLLDDQGAAVAGAELRFSPLDKRFTTDAAGRVRFELSFAEALQWDNRAMSFTVAAVDDSGQSHPVVWNPRWTMALEQPAPAVGDVILDLSGLGPDGIGGQLSRSSGGPLAGLTRLAARAGLLQTDSGAFGAAYTASPASQRQGQYAWQENLSQGGGIYELHADDQDVTGNLEITAPVEAFNDSGASSSCSDAVQGATIAGWNEDDIYWEPVPGTSINAAPPGSTTFSASAEVTLKAESSFGQSILQATQGITLYTVGHDLTPPAITQTLRTGARIASLPAVLAMASDLEAGVGAETGVTAMLGAMSLPVVFDPDTFEIRVPEGSRDLPDGLIGDRILEITVVDGFCNSATSSLQITIDPDAPPLDEGRTIYLPFNQQQRQ